MHIVFQQADVAALSKSFEIDENLRNEIFEIKDEYAVGPLLNIYEPEGIEARKEWWRKVLSGNDSVSPVDSGIVDDQKTLMEIKDKLDSDENEMAWVWVAPNKHDVSGYYWLISQLKDYAGKIFILHLNNLPFINEKGAIFYPDNLSEIPPREFVKAQRLARKVSLSEFETDPDEWTRLCNENKMVRILEGGKKLSQKDEDFYDKFIMEFITGEWQRAGKVIHQFLSKSKYTTGDAYMLWRLKELIAGDIIDAQGEIKSMKDFEVKNKVS